MTREIVLLSAASGVATITLNRPERQNAWIPAMTDGYTAALHTCARDPEVRAIVVTGAGGHWCSGGDGAVLDDIAAAGTTLDLPGERLPPYLARVVAKPVIAAVTGVCFGIGLFHALCCDVRVVAEDAKFSTAYARRGLPAEAGMSWLLPRTIGHGHAADLLFSARVIRGEEALRMGLVNRVVSATQVVATAQDYARTLAERCAPEALRMMKQQLHHDADDGFLMAFERADSLLAEATASDTFREGVASWREQRPPAFPPVGGAKGLLDWT